MTKVHLLGANRSYDRDVQTVSINQIVVLKGYEGGSYVVYDVTHNQRGFTYHLVHTRTYDFSTSDLIRPLSEKFGIGIYYDSENPTFLDPLETAFLLSKAKEKNGERRKYHGRNTDVSRKSVQHGCAPLSHRTQKPLLSESYG